MSDNKDEKELYEPCGVCATCVYSDEYEVDNFYSSIERRYCRANYIYTCRSNDVFMKNDWFLPEYERRKKEPCPAYKKKEGRFKTEGSSVFEPLGKCAECEHGKQAHISQYFNMINLYCDERMGYACKYQKDKGCNWVDVRSKNGCEKFKEKEYRVSISGSETNDSYYLCYDNGNTILDNFHGFYDDGSLEWNCWDYNNPIINDNNKKEVKKEMNKIEKLKEEINNIKNKRNEIIKKTIKIIDTNKEIQNSNNRLNKKFIKFLTNISSLDRSKPIKNIKKREKYIERGLRSLFFCSEKIEWWNNNPKNILKRNDFNIITSTSEEWEVILPLLNMIIENVDEYMEYYYRGELDKLRGVERKTNEIICRYCDGVNPENASFCNQCGERMGYIGNETV